MLATGPPSISILHPFQVLIVCCTYIVLLIPGALQITASFFFFFLILQELTGYLELALFSFLFLIPRYSLICTLHREDNYSFRIGKWLFH